MKLPSDHEGRGGQQSLEILVVEHFKQTYSFWFCQPKDIYLVMLLVLQVIDYMVGAAGSLVVKASTLQSGGHGFVSQDH